MRTYARYRPVVAAVLVALMVATPVYAGRQIFDDPQQQAFAEYVDKHVTMLEQHQHTQDEYAAELTEVIKAQGAEIERLQAELRNARQIMLYHHKTPLDYYNYTR